MRRRIRKKEKKTFFQKIIDFFKKLFHIKDKEDKKETESDTASKSPEQTVKTPEVPESSEVPATIKSPEDKSIANAEIDEKVIQGQRGDCALIATVETLANTEEGANAIKDAIEIKKDDDGNIVGYDVHFKGIGKTYSLSEEEVKEARKQNEGYLSEPDKDGWQTFLGGDLKYSKGDKDMFILEMAIEKAFNDSNDEKLKTTIEDRNHEADGSEDLLKNVNPSSVTYLLTGEEMNTSSIDQRRDRIFMNYDLKFNDTYTSKFDTELNDIDNNIVKINKNTEYKIINYTDEDQTTVTLKDKNTSKEYTFDKDE